MPTQRREQLDERMARFLREQRAKNIAGSAAPTSSMMISASFAFESWFDGDPPGTMPEPATDFQPAFEEPFVNLSDDPLVWDALDPYWLRVPAAGLWVVSMSAYMNFDVTFDAAGYVGLQTDVYAESWRSLPPGTDPVGRDDPFGVGAWGGISGGCYDTKFYPEGRESFNLTQSISGPPFELSEDDSIRALYRLNSLEAFAAGGFFSNSFQGQLTMMRVGPA